MNKLIYILGTALFLLSCTNNQIEEISPEEKSSALAIKQYVPTIIERKGIKLVEANDFPKFLDVTLNLNTTNQRIKKGLNTLEFNVLGFNLGELTTDQNNKNYVVSPYGQHLTLQQINSNEKKFGTTKVTFDFESGNNYILAYLSRSYNMSLKGEKSSVFFNVNLNENGSSISTNTTDTALFYVEPRGTFINSRTNKVLLDFYVANISLGEKSNYVSATINNQEFKLYNWKPYWIYGLPVGSHKIKIGLRNKNGKPLKSKFARDIEEIINIKEISILDN